MIDELISHIERNSEEGRNENKPLEEKETPKDSRKYPSEIIAELANKEYDIYLGDFGRFAPPKEISWCGLLGIRRLYLNFNMQEKLGKIQFAGVAKKVGSFKITSRFINIENGREYWPSSGNRGVIFSLALRLEYYGQKSKLLSRRNNCGYVYFKEWDLSLPEQMVKNLRIIEFLENKMKGINRPESTEFFYLEDHIKMVS